ncbi:hypothetical protein FRC06_004185 [Ceratobasidium sp. 370]|nr:hypothetical protein FRC06_004185 [Ceratobasidium sp. 370]
MDWNTITRQLLMSQGLATHTPGSRPVATTGRALTLPPELGVLPPQLIAALLSTLALNSAEPGPGSDLNPHSDMSCQASMVFKFGERPIGTAGRGEFNIQDALGLNDDDYDLILHTVRQICVLCHFNMNLVITKQHPDKVTRACAKIRKAFPGLALSAECKVPYWLVSRLLLVVMKASSQASQQQERRHEERESAASAQSTPDPTVPTVPTGPAPPAGGDNDEDEGMVGDMTVVLVNEMDKMNGSEGVDEDSSDDKVDGTPFLDPPAYNLEPIPTSPVIAPATTRKTHKTTPATTDNDHASLLAPVAEPTTIPTSTPNNATLVPVDPPAPVPNTHGHRRRHTKTTPTLAATTPTSTIAVATAIATPSAINTSVQAQASSTTGWPSDLADTSHFAVPPSLPPLDPLSSSFVIKLYIHSVLTRLGGPQS